MGVGRGIAQLATVPDSERRDGGPELVIRGEHPWLVSSRQAVPVLPWRRHEIGQPVQEVKRREFDDAVGARPRGLPPAPRADPTRTGAVSFTPSATRAPASATSSSTSTTAARPLASAGFRPPPRWTNSVLPSPGRNSRSSSISTRVPPITPCIPATSRRNTSISTAPNTPTGSRRARTGWSNTGTGRACASSQGHDPTHILTVPFRYFRFRGLVRRESAARCLMGHSLQWVSLANQQSSIGIRYSSSWLGWYGNRSIQLDGC
jgi:hypothetical protein